MYYKFTSVNDLKRRLPDTLDRIQTLKEQLYYANWVLNKVVELCLDEDVTGVDYGLITTEEFFNLCVDFRDITEEELNYLQDKIKSLTIYKNDKRL